MTAPRTVVLELTRMEAAHLAGLVAQFEELLTDAETASGDPAIARLVPDAYSDDAEAAQEFRRLTERDLLDRRRQDAADVLASLRTQAALSELPEDGKAAVKELTVLK